VPCPYCTSPHTKSRAKKTKRGSATFFCSACQRTYNERSGSPFNDVHSPTEIVFLVVFWRLRYKLSHRDLAEMFLERGFEFTHETVRAWEERFAPVFADALKAKRKGKVGKKWHFDETYLKVKGHWCYLYRAIDQVGDLVDVRLSQTRDLAAAEAFFKQSQQTVGHTPEKVTTDKRTSYPKAIRKSLGRKVRHRTSQYLNNRLEQDHRGVKQRYYPMRGLKAFESASRFCRAFEEQRQYFRSRAFRGHRVLLIRQRSLFKMRYINLKNEFVAA
jgi:putative transposase